MVYDKIAEPYAKEFSSPSGHIGEFLELIPKHGKILDVGCGAGVDSSYMHLKGFKIIGVDLSEGMLNFAKQKFPQLDFRLMDIRKINFKPNSFNGILASCSLIHIPKKDIPATLEGFYNIIKKGGVLYLALQGESQKKFL